MLVIKCGGCSFRFELAKVRRRPVSMNVDAKTPFVILANWVDVLASLTHVNKLITLPFKIKLITTIMIDKDPPKAAPKRSEKEKALQIGASATFPYLSFYGLLENFRFGLNCFPPFGEVY